MENKLKIGGSPIYLLIKFLIIVCILGFCVLTILGLMDFRSEEQKSLDYRKSLTNHTLFDDAKRFAQDILETPDSIVNRDTVKRISCLHVLVSISTQEKKKLVLIELKNSTLSFCYITYVGDSYIMTPEDNYRLYRNNSKTISELILEGEDLDILFEEAE